MLRRTLLAAAAVGTMAAGLPRAAEAVVFELVDVTTTTPINFPALRNDFPFRLDISSAAVTRGSFQLRGSGTGRPGEVFISGDVADFNSLLVLSNLDFVTPTRIRGQLDLAVTFALDRTISSFNIAYFGDVADAVLSGSGGNFISGPFGADRPDCNSSYTTGLCQVSGRLVEVPEPMSIALLGMGLVGMAAVRRTI